MEMAKGGRQTIKRQVSRLLSITLFLALAVGVSQAQVACLGVCEQNFERCLRTTGNGPQFSATCLETYEACVEACLGSAGAILM